MGVRMLADAPRRASEGSPLTYGDEPPRFPDRLLLEEGSMAEGCPCRTVV